MLEYIIERQQHLGNHFDGTINAIRTFVKSGLDVIKETLNTIKASLELKTEPLEKSIPPKFEQIVIQVFLL